MFDKLFGSKDDQKDAPKEAPKAEPKVEEKKIDASHPDHPEFRHPDAPHLPKHVTLDRQDVVGVTKLQSVTVNHGDSVEKILERANMSKGAHIVSPKSGFKIHPKDDFYRHVENGDEAKVVVEAE